MEPANGTKTRLYSPNDIGGSGTSVEGFNENFAVSPGGELAIVSGSKFNSEIAKWRGWFPPGGNASPTYVPGIGESSIQYSYGGNVVEAIEDGGCMVVSRSGAAVVSEGASEFALPNTTYASRHYCISRVPKGVAGASRIVVAATRIIPNGTDYEDGSSLLWIKNGSQVHAAVHTPTIGQVRAISNNGVVLGKGAIWHNGQAIALDTLVENQKVSGPTSATRYTNLVGLAMNGEGAIVATADDPLNSGDGHKTLILLLPVEVVEVSPKTKDEEGNDIAGSEKPSTGKPLTPFVELSPVADKIAHRELKVKIGEALQGKSVTWTLEPVPDATPATIRGAWTNSTTHPNRFEASATYGANGFTSLSQASSKTTVANDGFTAIRVNVPPIGFNQVRIEIQVEGATASIDLIDMEVPGVVVIDPGHGGTTNVQGSSSNNAVSPSGVLEKTMTLDYGLALRDSLRAKRQQDKLNLRVFMTREIDENKSGEDRGHKARDNGADVLFVLHFNSDDDSGTTAHPRVPHRSRGTLEVYRTDSNVSPQEDTGLSSDLIDCMVAAMTPFDAGANHRTRVAYGGNGVGGPAVSSDVYNGNTATYHPIRTAYIEGDFIDFGANTAADHTDDAVDILLNTGPNAPTVKTAITDAIRDGILQNIRDQP